MSRSLCALNLPEPAILNNMSLKSFAARIFAKHTAKRTAKWVNRPIETQNRVFDELIDASTIKPEVLKGVDLFVVRELTGGIYFGQPREKNADMAFNTMVYTKEEIKRIAVVAFDSAMKRRKSVCSVDKANVLEVSQL